MAEYQAIIEGQQYKAKLEFPLAGKGDDGKPIALSVGSIVTITKTMGIAEVPSGKANQIYIAMRTDYPLPNNMKHEGAGPFVCAMLPSTSLFEYFELVPPPPLSEEDRAALAELEERSAANS